MIKTDLRKEIADKQVVHDRYKGLAELERAFKEMKTGFISKCKLLLALLPRVLFCSSGRRKLPHYFNLK